MKNGYKYSHEKIKTLKKLWKGTGETIKLKFLKSFIFPIATYGSETWCLSKQAEQKINALQTKSFRRILRVPWKKEQMGLYYNNLEKWKIIGC